MLRRPPRSTQSRSSAASDVYKRQASGIFDFVVRATDATGCQGLHSYTLHVTCGAIVVSPGGLPAGVSGSAYSQTLTGSGGTAPYSFAVTSGSLPGGLTLSAAGAIAGTPTLTGSYVFGVTATDAAGCTADHSYRINVTCPAISISPTSLLSGTIGTPYSQTLTASGGVAPYGFVLIGGALPPGLSLSGTGDITGTPTTNGSYSFSVQA